MALLNKRSRNIEGLLANRLTGGGTDRGTHGYNMGNKNFYSTKGQEGKNFLKAVDKHYNRDDWGSGASPFMQGPSSPGKDRILGMLPDSEALDDFATDKASEEGGSPNWDDLPSIQHDSYKTKYSHSDELGPDSEALEEAAMDEASEMQMLADVNAVPQAAGDERFMKEFAKKGKRVNDPKNLWDDVKEGASGLYDKAKGLFATDEEANIQKITNPAFQKVDAANQAMLDAQIMDKGNVGEAEGAEAADRRQQFQDMSKRLNLPGISDKISKSQMSEDQLRMMGPQYEKTSMGAAYLDEGESELDRIGRENMLEAGLNEELGPDKIDTESSFGERLSQGRIGDAFSGLFSSDDEGGGKKKKKMSKEAMKYGADLMKGMMQEPSQGQRQMPTSKVTRGSVPFAGLLAQKTPRQRNPYFTPKGLV